MYTKPILYTLLGNQAAAAESERAEIAQGDASRWSQLTSVVLQLADSIQSLAGKQPSDDSAMSVEQAAKRLAVSKGVIYRLCQDSVMPHNKVGRRVTITAAQLDDYQKRQPQESSTLRYV